MALSKRPNGLAARRTVPQATRATNASSVAKIAMSDTPLPHDANNLGKPGKPCTPFVSQLSCWMEMRTASEKPSVTMAR